LPYSPLGGGMLSGKYLAGAWPQNARFSTYRRSSDRGEVMTRRFVNDKTLKTTELVLGLARECNLSPVTFADRMDAESRFVPLRSSGATRVEQSATRLKGRRRPIAQPKAD